MNDYSKYLLIPSKENTSINSLLNDKSYESIDSIYNMKLVTINKKNSKHYVPANKVWLNSIYSYNKNYAKALPLADIATNNILKDYFNMNPLIDGQVWNINSIIENKTSLNKIILSKSEIKHTSDKIELTVYIYNRNKITLLHNIEKLLCKVRLLGMAKNAKRNLIQKKSRYYINNKKRIVLFTKKWLNLFTKAENFSNTAIKSLNDDNKLRQKFSMYEKQFMQEYKDLYFENELLHIYYIRALAFNNNKFKNWLLLGLKNKISKLYNKKVELNIVNQKAFYLNSDILTNTLATRVRDRNNKVLTQMKMLLQQIQLPSKYLRNLYYFNFPKSNGIITSNNAYNNKLMLQSKVLSSIKYKRIFGIRLEAAGRLTMRLIAARSVFKLVYKGGLRNLDRVKNNESTLLLRGNTKPNVQYTNINSKTRNGAFGLKGWINNI